MGLKMRTFERDSKPYTLRGKKLSSQTGGYDNVRDLEVEHDVVVEQGPEHQNSSTLFLPASTHLHRMEPKAGHQIA
jgi:hypothetical protein